MTMSYNSNSTSPRVKEFTSTLRNMNKQYENLNELKMCLSEGEFSPNFNEVNESKESN